MGNACHMTDIGSDESGCVPIALQHLTSCCRFTTFFTTCHHLPLVDNPSKFSDLKGGLTHMFS